VHVGEPVRVRDNRANTTLPGDVQQCPEVGGGVHAGAEKRDVVEVEPPYIKVNRVTAQRAGHDPPSAISHGSQARSDAISGDDIEHDADPVRDGCSDLLCSSG